MPAANLTGTIAAARLSTATTQVESDDSTKIATTAYVTDKITTLIGGAPSTLNDLNELAAAINDDANYNTTLTTALGTKLPLAGGAMTGPITTNSTFDGVDISVRDAVLTSTTTIAAAALPKAGGTMTGDLQLYKATPIITLQRSDNTTLPGLSWQGSGGAEAASIKLDGTGGMTNSLIMSTYNGSTMAERLRLMTSAAGGIAVTGTISVTGTVDGRDVAADGTKLDTIETNATADQTAAQLLTAIKTVDGTGSGLDADLLDGQQGSYYQKKTTVQDAVPSGATGEFWYESDTSVLHVYYGGAWVDTAPGLQISDNLQINSLGVGTAASSTAGEIRATNDVTAYYSDARLKNFESTIDGALDKVKQLNGYYFTENEIAKELGYDNDKRQVGVSAQEVEAVLPEIVTEAPISDEYLTVKYEKLAPLFIEAIKEIDEKYQAKHTQQQAQIDTLIQEINRLKGN